MLWAPANGLHGSPHVFVWLHQVPASGKELISFQLSTFVGASGAACLKVHQHLAPGQIAIALDHDICPAALKGLFRKQCRVDSAVDYFGPPLMCEPADFVSSQGIARMHTDPNYIAGLDRVWIELFERFIHEDWIAHGRRSCSGQNK